MRRAPPDGAALHPRDGSPRGPPARSLNAAPRAEKMHNTGIPLTGGGPENGGLLFDDAGKIGDDFRFIVITTPEYGHFVRDTRRRKLDNVLVSDLNGGVGQDIVIGRIKQE